MVGEGCKATTVLHSLCLQACRDAGVVEPCPTMRSCCAACAALPVLRCLPYLQVLVAAQQALDVLMQSMPPLRCIDILAHKLPSEDATSSGTAVDGEVLCATIQSLQVSRGTQHPTDETDTLAAAALLRNVLSISQCITDVCVGACLDRQAGRQHLLTQVRLLLSVCFCAAAGGPKDDSQ